MILLQTKNKFGLFLAALAIALLILTVFYAANLDGDHQSNNVLNALCASTLLSAMTAISNLTPSFIPRGEERSHLQEYERMVNRPNFEPIRHRGIYIAGNSDH